MIYPEMESSDHFSMCDIASMEICLVVRITIGGLNSNRGSSFLLLVLRSNTSILEAAAACRDRKSGRTIDVGR